MSASVWTDRPPLRDRAPFPTVARTPAPPPKLPEAFKRLPYLLYREDPLWTPESSTELDRLFHASHGYFAHGRAAAFVLCGEARLACFYDPRLRIDGRRVATFGYWESVDAVRPNARLFAEAERWARAQGAERLYGPVDFSTHRRYRLRLNRFDDAPFPGEPYHPMYYPRLLAALGYRVAETYATLGTSKLYGSAIGALVRQKAPYVGRLPTGVQMRALTREEWLGRLREIRAFVDLAFGPNPGYLPLPGRDFRALYGEAFARRLCPHTSRIAVDARGELAGFLVAFPDYGPLVQQGNPRQGNPARVDPGALDYARHFPLLERPCFLAKTAAVRADYRRRGLLSALSTDAARASLARYADGKICLMHQRNPSLRYGLGIADLTRQYGLFTKDL